jgi:hypothetical protein
MPARSSGRPKRDYLKLTRFLEKGNRLLRSDSKTITTMLPMRPAMLVDLVRWFCEPQQRGEALGAAGVFSTFGFGRKSMLGIFFEPKAKR